MKTLPLEETALFEHRFWLQILGDHGRFILNSLSPKETMEIERAQSFINDFDSLLEQARQPVTAGGLMALTQEAYRRSMDLRSFKLHLLKRHLMGKIGLGLPPTFINHMLNELEEYLMVLQALLSSQVPSAPALHHHVLWLLDGSGHAASIESDLDEVEKDLIERSREFNKTFKDLYNKAQELSGYTRTGLCDFPAVTRLNNQADMNMRLFMKFLEELKEMRLNNQVLGRLMPIVPDHMYREECYYLTKLSQVADIKTPGCDPGKPRIEL